MYKSSIGEFCGRKIDQYECNLLYLIAEMLALQGCTDTAANLITIANTRYLIAIGTPPKVALPMEEATAASVRTIGNQMANVMYNLAQQIGKPLERRDCQVIDQLRRQWMAPCAFSGKRRRQRLRRSSTTTARVAMSTERMERKATRRKGGPINPISDRRWPPFKRRGTAPQEVPPTRKLQLFGERRQHPR
jgi:hypothetical protein